MGKANKSFISFFIIILLINSIFIIKNDSSLDAASNGDGDLIIDSSNSPFYISATQKFNSIVVKGTGKLVISKSGELDVSKLELKSGSIFENSGGKLTISDEDSVGSSARLNGSCKFFNVTNGASISLVGADGGSAIIISQGGMALIEICVSEGIKLKDSMITVHGGNGGDYTHDATMLGDTIAEEFISAGGDGGICFTTSKVRSICINNSTLIAVGGNGGTVTTGNGANSNGGAGSNSNGIESSTAGGTAGAGQNGGIASSGGKVQGFVGSGGNGIINITFTEIEISKSKLNCTGGNAGSIQTGTGGSSIGGSGGTANGYFQGTFIPAPSYWGDGGSGGTAGTCGKGGRGGNGGNISGHGGFGGSGKIFFNGESIIISESEIQIFSGTGNASTGNGGAARGGGGNGKFPNAHGGAASAKAGASGTYGSGGSGGIAKSGGSGGTGGSGGNLEDYAGAGGECCIDIRSKSLMIEKTDFNCYSGSGNGKTGSGGGAPGGDGGSANGGAGSGGNPGGDGGTAGNGGFGGVGGKGGNIIDYAAKGGFINITLKAIDALISSSKFQLKSADGHYSLGSGSIEVPGGTGGTANGGSGTPAGSTGSSGSSGTAGTYGEQGAILNYAGNGGDINLDLQITNPTIVNTTNLKIITGTGKGSGLKFENIPMSKPRLLSPEDGFESRTNTKPIFIWTALLDASNNGQVAGYEFQLAYDFEFNSIYRTDIITANSYKLPIELEDNIYYWRVKAIYKEPPGSNIGWSEIYKFILDTTPIKFQNQTPDSNTWSNSLTVNCTINISDAISGVKGSSLEYCYSITGENGFCSWVQANKNDNCKLLSCFVTLNLDEGTDNYIKWRGSDLLNNGPIESTNYRIKIDITDPEVTLIYPQSGDAVNSLNPIFRWSARDELAGLNGKCDFELSTFQDFSTIVYKDQIITETYNDAVCNFSLPIELTDGKYYFRVRVSDNADNWCEFTEPTAFYIDTELPACTILEPSSEEWLTSNTPILVWEVFDETSGIMDGTHIQIATASEFKEEMLIFDDIIYNTESEKEIIHFKEYQYSLDVHLLDGVYYWRVRAQDNARAWGPFSKISKLNIDTQVPKFKNFLPNYWLNSSNVSMSIEIIDDQSGVLGSSVQYAYSTSGVIDYGPWSNLSMTLDSSSIVPQVRLNLTEGDNNFIKWRAKDVAGNGYNTSIDHGLKLDLHPPEFSNPTPRTNDLLTQNLVECGITITDKLSGVDLSRIEYRISLTGPTDDTFGPWATLAVGQIEASNFVRCKINLTFPSGNENFIQWRAMDIARTGWAVSEVIQINISPDKPLLNDTEDTDGDQIPDIFETEHGLNKSDPSDALLDIDLDGLSNLLEFQYNTSLSLADSDSDGLNDSAEVFIYGTDPLSMDTDGDGFADGKEIDSKTDPKDKDDYPRRVSSKMNSDNIVLILGIVIVLLVIFLSYLFIHRRSKKDQQEERVDKDTEKISGICSENEDDDVKPETRSKDYGGWKFVDDEDDYITNEFTLRTNAFTISQRSLTVKQKDYEFKPETKKIKIEKPVVKDIVNCKTKDKAIGKRKGDNNKNLPKVHKIKFDQKHPNPFLHKATSSLKCGICFGYVKTDLMVITCVCGKNYHELCARRIGLCPSCETDLKAPVKQDIN